MSIFIGIIYLLWSHYFRYGYVFHKDWKSHSLILREAWTHVYKRYTFARLLKKSRDNANGKPTLHFYKKKKNEYCAWRPNSMSLVHFFLCLLGTFFTSHNFVLVFAFQEHFLWMEYMTIYGLMWLKEEKKVLIWKAPNCEKSNRSNLGITFFAKMKTIIRSIATGLS